jgi:hypothetical protein
MLERTPSGNEVVTTMLPMYADGTDEFVVLEARHWIAKTGQIVVGQDSFGPARFGSETEGGARGQGRYSG